MTVTWLPAPGVLQRQPTAAQGSECCDQGRPHAPAQDRSPLQWTGAVVTTAYLPTKTLHDVVPQVRPRFEELLAHAASLGLKPSIRSAGRTCEEQAEQVAGGYSHADLCRSMHVLGHAVDLDLSPNTCESHTKLGAWWESRGGVWGGRWKQFGACGDMGHYHFGFSGAGAVPTATCPSGVTLEQCQKLREEYLDRAYSAGPGVSSRGGLWAGALIVAAGAAFVWAALSVKPGRLAAARENPTTKVHVQFFSLTGQFRAVRKQTFSSVKEAEEAIREHAASAGYTGVKAGDDEEDWGSLRYTAKTPGGRSGRNIALADVEEDESFP